jgi:hypothetical protein
MIFVLIRFWISNLRCVDAVPTSADGKFLNIIFQSAVDLKHIN